jgi:hypothetical protein
MFIDILLPILIAFHKYVLLKKKTLQLFCFCFCFVLFFFCFFFFLLLFFCVYFGFGLFFGFGQLRFLGVPWVLGLWIFLGGFVRSFVGGSRQVLGF